MFGFLKLVKILMEWNERTFLVILDNRGLKGLDKCFLDKVFLGSPFNLFQ